MSKYWAVAVLALVFIVVCDQLALRRLNDFSQLQGRIIDDYWNRLHTCKDANEDQKYLIYQRDRATDFVESLARCGFMKLKPEACGMTQEKVKELLEENRR